MAALTSRWLQDKWVHLGLFTLLALVCFIDRFVLGSLLTPIKAELHLTDEQLGRLNLIFVIAYIGIVPVAGYLGDRLPRKWFVFGSLVLWSLASIGSGLATALGGLLVWRSLVGVGEGIFSSFYPSWIADLFGPRLRGIAFATLQSTSQVGAWVAYVMGGTIAAASSWHDAFLVAGIPGLVLAVGVIFLREPRRGQADGHVGPDAPAKPTWREIGGLFRDPNYLLYIGGYTIRMLGVSGLFFWGAVFLHREFGISNREATAFVGSTYFFTGAPGIFLAGFLAGWLARRFRGAYALWLAGGEVLAGTTVLLMLLFAHDLATAKTLFLIQTFFAGNSWGVITPLLLEIAPVRLRGVAISFSLAVATGGSAFLVSELIGGASDHYGIRNALFLIPIGYFLAAIFWSVLAWRQSRARTALPVDPAPSAASEPALQSA